MNYANSIGASPKYCPRAYKTREIRKLERGGTSLRRGHRHRCTGRHRHPEGAIPQVGLVHLIHQIGQTSSPNRNFIAELGLAPLSTPGCSEPSPHQRRANGVWMVGERVLLTGESFLIFVSDFGLCLSRVDGRPIPQVGLVHLVCGLGLWLGFRDCLTAHVRQ